MSENGENTRIDTGWRHAKKRTRVIIAQAIDSTDWGLYIETPNGGIRKITTFKPKATPQECLDQINRYTGSTFEWVRHVKKATVPGVKKAGYRYLKDKYARLEKEYELACQTLTAREKEIEDLNDQVAALQDENERAVFERLVKNIKDIKGWR